MADRRVQAGIPDFLADRLDRHIEQNPYWTYKHPSLGVLVGGRNTTATVLRQALHEFLDDPPETIEGTAEEIKSMLEIEAGEEN
jgi:hypothetical protein